MTSDLGPDIVGRELFIEQRGSEYMSSVFVIVNNGEIKTFEREVAEGLTPAKLYIYPEHTGVIQRISADKDYSLYVLWAMNDSADGERMPKTDVLTALKMKRYHTRTDVEWDPELAKETAEKSVHLKQELQTAETRLQRFSEAVFGEAYVNYLHLKAIVVFVEAVLRYGLSKGETHYIAYALQPKPKQYAKLRDLLHSVYKKEGVEDGTEQEGGGTAGKQYFPYVSECIANFAEKGTQKTVDGFCSKINTYLT